MEPTKGIVPHVDLAIYPWGNAYYAGLPGCGKGTDYDPDVRACWAKSCASSPDSCFDGTLVHQHGPVEGDANTLFSCLLKHTPGPVAGPALDTMACVEAGYDELKNPPYSSGTKTLDDLFKGCGGSDAVAACAAGSEGKTLQEVAAKATPQHPGVPYILLDGASVDNPLEIQAALCRALAAKGVKPPGCAGAQELVI